MHNVVSVVIPTLNRSNDLRQCLGSLACQTVQIDELIVVDNGSSDDTLIAVNAYKKAVSFKVRLISERFKGYSAAYNRCLKEASGSWVAIIDDDCVADHRWYERIKIITERFPKISAILGNSSEYHSKSVVALSKAFIDDVGKIGAINNTIIVDHEILDSKNIVYNKKILSTNNLQFDKDLQLYGSGASEDCDFGMQIFQAGGLALYDHKMRVMHKDVTELKSYFRKTRVTLSDHLVYEKKWANVRKQFSTERPLYKKIILFNSFRKKYDLSFLKTAMTLLLVIITFFYIKVLRIMFMPKINGLNIPQK